MVFAPVNFRPLRLQFLPPRHPRRNNRQGRLLICLEACQAGDLGAALSALPLFSCTVIASEAGRYCSRPAHSRKGSCSTTMMAVSFAVISVSLMV